MLEQLPEPAYPYKVFDRIEDPMRNFWWLYVQYREIGPDYARRLYEEAVRSPDDYIEKGREQIEWAYRRMRELHRVLLSEELTLERFMVGVYYMTTTYMKADREIIIDGYPGEYALEYYAKDGEELRTLEEIKKALSFEKVDKFWFEIQDFFYEELPEVDLGDVKNEFVEEVRAYLNYEPVDEGEEYKEMWRRYIQGPFFRLPYLSPGTGRLRRAEILPAKLLRWRDPPAPRYRGISPGVVVGQVIYYVGDEMEEVEKKISKVEHPILFAIHTQPKDTPLFYKVRGVIVAEGGMLSHTGILAREVGIPAVSGVPFMSIPEYSWVVVDGTRGIVRQITEGEAKEIIRRLKGHK